MATLEGYSLLRAIITEPELGVWHAEVEVDHDEALTGGVSFTIDDETWSGTVVPGLGGLDFGRWRGTIVGGQGGLSAELQGKSYAGGVTVKQPLDDILRETGETLSSTVSTTLTGHALAAWQRMRGPASRALVALVDELGCSWRVLRGGTVWIGEDAWSDADLDGETLIDEDWGAGRLVLKDAASLTPGQTYDGHQIKRVVHYLQGSSFTTEGWTQGDMLSRILDRVRRQTDFHRLWPARVVSQHADGTLELYPDDERLRGMGGLDKIKLRHGLPGVAVELVAGARVRVGFDAGDPKRPYAALFDEDSTRLDDLVVTAQTKAQILGPTVVVGGDSDYLALAAKVDAALIALSNTFTAWTPVPNDGGAALKTLLITLQTGPPTWPASVAASKAKGE